MINWISAGIQHEGNDASEVVTLKVIHIHTLGVGFFCCFFGFFVVFFCQLYTHNCMHTIRGAHTHKRNNNNNFVYSEIYQT